MGTPVAADNAFVHVIHTLKEGLESALQTLSGNESAQALSNQLQDSLPLLGQLEEWTKTLPIERLHETLLAIVVSIHRILTHAVRHQELDPSLYGADAANPMAPFLVDALLEIGPPCEVGANGMVVMLTIPSDQAGLWTADTLEQGLKRQGIVYGIKKDPLENALKHPGKSFKVAIGTEPAAGRDAVMEDCLELDSLDGSPTIQANGQANLKFLHWLCPIAKGQTILKKTPATAGVPGTDVRGNPIPAEDGVDMEFPKTENTELSEDQLQLLSTVDGCIFWEKDHLKVTPALNVTGNVDFSTGNIHVSIPVTVQKDVLSDFKIESKQEVLVKGTVEGAAIHSEGNVELQGGVQGREKAWIVSQNNIFARYLDLAHVEAKELIQVENSILHSHVICRRLMVSGNPGEIVGGQIDAGLDVCANQFGSDVGVKTVVHLGKDIQDVRDELEQLEAELPPWNERLERFAATQKKLETQSGKGLSAEKKNLLQRAQIGAQKAKNKLVELQEAIDHKKDQMEQARQAVRTVRARKNIFPGVIVEILGQKHTFLVPTGPATVTLAGDTIQVLPYQDRDFQQEEEVE